jgi:hypothetical protein
LGCDQTVMRFVNIVSRFGVHGFDERITPSGTSEGTFNTEDTERRRAERD